MNTLIVLRSLQIGERLFRTSEEMPPDFLTREAVDLAIDRRELAEVPERKSLFKMFNVFSGTSESENLRPEHHASCL